MLCQEEEVRKRGPWSTRGAQGGGIRGPRILVVSASLAGGEAETVSIR